MKKTGSWNGLIAMAAILAMSVCVFGCTDQQTTTVASGQGSTGIKGSISGLVVDINNNPVAKAKVTLRSTSDTQTKRTDSAGTYVFSGVPVSGQLGCYNDCEENPYLIVVESPVEKVDGVEVVPYVTSYTAALLSFTSLQAIGAGDFDSTTGDWNAVGNMQVQAITAVMRRPNATVSGYVIDTRSGMAGAGALVTLNPSSYASPPDPWEIWYDEEPTFAIGDPTTVTNALGLFTFMGVPEGSDSVPVEYTVTVSAPGLQLCDFCGHPEVSVGTGGHEAYWVDAECGLWGDGNEWNQADPVALCPALPPSDRIRPYVIATNVPSEVIPASQAGATFCWKFNEPMNADTGDGSIIQTGGAPVALSTALSGWNVDLLLFDPPLTDPSCIPDLSHPVYYVTPQDPLAQGRNYEFRLRQMEDVSANPYDGYTPTYDPDAFYPDDFWYPIVAKYLRTSGDPTLMCVASLQQDAAALGTDPRGGRSSNVPQANNLNLLFCDDGPTIGDQNEEADWISLSWQAATPCMAGEDGVVSSYNVYAENTGLGFSAGVPLQVGSTGGAWGGPTTSWDGYIYTVNAAITNYNNSNDPDIPLVVPSNYFDDGFTLPMAVTAVNNDNLEGPYSNIVQVRDVVPPTVADQGEGFDETVPTNWAVLTVGPDEVDLPGLGTIDAELTDDNVYDAASYTAWLAVQHTLNIGMSEDLLEPQPPSYPGAQLVAAGGGGETVASASVTQYEGGGDCDLAEVTVVMNNLALVQQNDHIGITVVDETGLNLSTPGIPVGGLLNGDSVVHLYDGVPPLITSGVVQNGAAPPEEVMTLTFAEPVEQTSAETPGNYWLNSGGLPGDATAALDVDGVTVVITAPTGFGVTDGVYSVLATVEDAQGNAQSFAPGALWFAVGDQIAPLIMTAYHSAAPDINTALPGDDGIWSVGDTAPETYVITIEYTEALAPAIAVVYTAAVDAACSATDIDTVTCGSLCAEITVDCTTGTVAEGDTLDVTAADLSGNPLTPDITLLAANGGTNVDPTEFVCGNDVAEGLEVCDGTDLAGETCVTQGFGSGELACLGDCSDFDTSACVPIP